MLKSKCQKSRFDPLFKTYYMRGERPYPTEYHTENTVTNNEAKSNNEQQIHKLLEIMEAYLNLIKKGEIIDIAPILLLLQKSEELEVKYAGYLEDNLDFAINYYKSLHQIQKNAAKQLFKTCEERNPDELEIFILTYLSFSISKDIAAQSKDILKKQFESFIENKKELTQKNIYKIYRICASLAHEGDPKLLKKIQALLEEKSSTEPPMKNLAYSLTAAFASDKSPNIQKLGFNLLKTFCEKIGLPTEETRVAWISNSNAPRRRINKPLSNEDAKILEEVFVQNLHTVTTLEEKRPGICRDLYQKFGVLNFGRFDPKIWLHQEKEQNEDKPYVLIIAAQDDWNARTFERSSRQTYSDLFKSLDGKCALRIIEAGDKLQLAKKIVSLKRKYKTPPSAVIFYGHNKKEFALGEARKGRKHFKNFISPKIFSPEDSRIDGYLDLAGSNTTFIMDGCGTQRPNTFISTLGKRTGNEVIFPGNETVVENFNAKVLDDGRVTFDNIKYAFGVQPIRSTSTIKMKDIQLQTKDL